MLGLTKAAALETVTTGITCNSICLRWVLTPLVLKQIGAIAVFLCSKAAAQIRGMPVDGGWIAQ